MPKIKSCQFNHDTACVDLIFDSGEVMVIAVRSAILKTTFASALKNASRPNRPERLQENL